MFRQRWIDWVVGLGVALLLLVLLLGAALLMSGALLIFD